MLKRREFLKTSVVVASVASTGILTAKAESDDSVDALKRIDFVLVDIELEDSVSFAAALIGRGARAFSVQQDIGRLWFGELGEAFKAGHSIAGLTSHSELLVCSTFARQHGARVRFEGSHDCRGSDVLTHSLRVAASDQPFSALLASADHAWPQMLAEHVMTLSRGDSLREERCRTTTPRSPTHPGSLFSWVIA
jgi:hypothetical protein